MKKASKRLYFLVQLKRSRVPRQDMSTFYTASIRSVLTYAAPASLCLSIVPKTRVGTSGKRAMSIICPGLPYQEAIKQENILPIVDFITGLCHNTFDIIVKDSILNTV